METKNLAKRIFMSLFGVIICAISVGVFKIAALGVDPFQSFMAGLDNLVPLDFGLLYIIVNALLLSAPLALWWALWSSVLARPFI